MSIDADKKCCVPKCQQTRSNGVILHKFPDPAKDNARFYTWVCTIGGDIWALDNRKIYMHRRVCHTHFEVKYHTTSKRLAANAVPTLFLTGDVQITATSEVTKNQTETESLLTENDVCSGQDEPKHIIRHESAIPVQAKDAFSWQSEPMEIQDEAEQCDDDASDNLSMYHDDNQAGTVTAKKINDICKHEGFHCDNCNGDIIGYRYTCVQCSNLDLCVACESGGAHANHYMLRVPGPRLYNEIQTVLTRIRRYLLREMDPISLCDSDKDDVVSVKSEIKSEIEDEEINKVKDTDAILALDVSNCDFNQVSKQLSFETRNNKISKQLSPEARRIQRHLKISKFSEIKQKNQRLVQIRKLNKEKLVNNPIQQQVISGDANAMKQTRKPKLIPIEKLYKAGSIDNPVQDQVDISRHVMMNQARNQKTILLRKLNENELVRIPVQTQVKTPNAKQETNQSAFVRTPPPSTAKRKNILSLSLNP